jgi:hypothetical protein
METVVSRGSRCYSNLHVSSIISVSAAGIRSLPLLVVVSAWFADVSIEYTLQRFVPLEPACKLHPTRNVR